MDDPLELETRRRIYQYVQKRPGAHMREIGRDLDVPMGTLEYHLHYLVKANLLVTRQDPRYTRYFAEGELSRRDKDVLAVLRQKVPRQIAAHLLLAPRSSHGALLEKFALAPSTLSFHLKKLVGTGIVAQEKAGRENLYTVVEPDLVARVLIQHRETFFDDVVDRFAEVWQGLEPRPPPADEVGPGGGVLMVLQSFVSAAFA
ncbi:MAG TPA: helix-turn-helix domain-containing protein [Candidatus Thermoplasmatota archaeon]|nr:helix-turn-helix domain-containing protein [Candidatus Thermoplasmatota archaeon]